MQSTKMLEATHHFLVALNSRAIDRDWALVSGAEKAMEEVQRFRSLPEIVCLCGSGRFVQQFQDANLRLSVEGKIVLSIGSDNLHTDSNIRVDAEAKAMLDALHFRKIDLCDRIHVLNINGYIGKNTLAEIRYAVEHDKQVTFASDDAWFWDQPDPQKRISIASFMAGLRQGVPNGKKT